ncbi:MAG: Na/Pi cotransporter family protein, partial [Erysipelotrichaceae bacterium]|nr:Na/Pi cotransporter family protein [Erysipelotrichaceae bacterium]
MNILNVISLFGGLALFLYGMRIMGNGLKQGSSQALKKVLEKVTNNTFMGFLLGILVTALIQSSNATVILASGLVGAGMLTLHQTVGIIIGANVGTTITGQIIRLLDIDSSGSIVLEFFKPSTLAPVAAIAGIICIMALKSKNSDIIGNVLMGFGILFTGLISMTAAVSPLSQSPLFQRVITGLSGNPFIGVLVGFIMCFIIQSASASVGILQALSVTGLLSFGSIYSVILGIYLGSCAATAAVASIGARADAKRTGVVHIIYNIIKVILIFIGVTILRLLGFFDATWSAPITSGGIANANTIFNLAVAALILPMSSMIEKIATRLVKDDVEEDEYKEDHMLDKAFYRSPELALSAAFNVIRSISDMINEDAPIAFDLLLNYDEEKIEKLKKDEDHINSLTDRVIDYLDQMPKIIDNEPLSNHLNYYVKCVMEYERIGDYIINISEDATELNSKELSVSANAAKEVSLMKEISEKILKLTTSAFIDNDAADAFRIEPLEETIDDLSESLKDNHLKRYNAGICSA